MRHNGFAPRASTGLQPANLATQSTSSVASQKRCVTTTLEASVPDTATTHDFRGADEFCSHVYAGGSVCGLRLHAHQGTLTEPKCCTVTEPHHHLHRDGKDYGPICEPSVGEPHPSWCRVTHQRLEFDLTSDPLQLEHLTRDQLMAVCRTLAKDFGKVISDEFGNASSEEGQVNADQFLRDTIEQVTQAE